MKTKLSVLQGHIKQGEYEEAILIAAKFSVIDADHKDIIERGAGAINNPAVYIQLGRSVDVLIYQATQSVCKLYKDKIQP